MSSVNVNVSITVNKEEAYGSYFPSTDAVSDLIVLHPSKPSWSMLYAYRSGFFKDNAVYCGTKRINSLEEYKSTVRIVATAMNHFEFTGA